MMNKRGFVNVVVMNGLIIIAIIGIIAAIALPRYINYKNRPLNQEAKAHAYQAYEASQVLFRINPKARPTREDIEKYGYRSSLDILLIIEGGKENLSIQAKHMKSNKMYRINAKGELSSD